VWLLSAFLLSVSTGTAAGQSGRRAPGSAKRNEPPPATTPEAAGESESQPKTKTPKTQAPPALSFIVCEFDNPFLDVAYISPSQMVEAFARRLGETKAVAVERGPKISRQEVRARAKNEREAYVVLVQLEEASADTGRETMGQVNPRYLVMRFYVYAPQSGDLKYQDRITQRPYRPTTTIGGIRIPVPSPRTVIPGQNELEQLARDAADRLLIRFNMRPPPEH
jgi:hypothetical protein